MLDIATLPPLLSYAELLLPLLALLYMLIRCFSCYAAMLLFLFVSLMILLLFSPCHDYAATYVTLPLAATLIITLLRFERQLAIIVDVIFIRHCRHAAPYYAMLYFFLLCHTPLLIRQRDGINIRH